MKKEHTVLARPDSIEYLTGRIQKTDRPSNIKENGAGGKFAPDGSVQPWAGTTLICHIDRSTDAHAALCAMQSKIKASPFSRRFTYLPPASFHMTVFQGRSPFRENTPHWPDGSPVTMTRDAHTQHICERTEGLLFPEEFVIKADGLHTLHSVTVRGATDEQEAALRATRETLRDAIGLKPSDFYDYIFHISLGYLLEWVSEAEASDMVALSSELGDEFSSQLSQIKLGPIEICNFENMYHFEPVKILTTKI